MKITNIIVEKIEKGNPHYPDQANVTFSEAYRCEVTFDDGRQGEAGFFVTEVTGPMTAENANKMLSLFGRAISRFEAADAA